MRKRVVALLVALLISAPVCGAEVSAADFSNSGYSVLTKTEDRSTGMKNQVDGSIFGYSSLTEGAAQVKAQFLNGNGNVTVKVWADSNDAASVYNQLSEMILNETYSSDEGDYLRWDIGSETIAYNYIKYANVYCYTFDIEVDFITSQKQKELVNEKVKEIVEGFGFDSSTTDYEKVVTIYNYLCDNVVYADDISDEIVFTSYSALFNGEAVCQGYAQLFYKMAKEVGLDVRVVPGYAESTKENHGWNIVKIGDVYYNVDATWDASRRQADLQYKHFLKGDSFTGHIRKDEYNTEEFYNEYPMSSTDYYATSNVDNEATNRSDAKIVGFNSIKPTIKKATKKRVKLAKVSGATKYQIKYSTSRKVKKNAKTANTNKTTYKFNNLKEGKTYYVKVRAYKVVDGKKVTTKWSKIKRVKA